MSTDRQRPTGAVIEIIEPEAENQTFLLPRQVKVNGTDVGLIESVTVDPGDGKSRAATVTLTLLPSRVEIKAEEHARR